MKNKTLFESTLWKELFLVSKMNWQKLNAILQHEQSFPMQCWSEVLEANKSYSVYSGHITMLQSCKPLTISAHSRSWTAFIFPCLPLSRKSHRQDLLLSVLFAPAFGHEKHAKTHPTICVLLHWMVPTRQVSEVLLGSTFSANWDLSPWAHHLEA